MANSEEQPSNTYKGPKLKNGGITRHDGKQLQRKVFKGLSGNKVNVPVHADMEDLTAPISVYMPKQKTVVELPTTAAGMSASLLAPAALAHELVTSMITWFSHMASSSNKPPSASELKKLLDCLKQSSELMANAWSLAQNQTKGVGVANVVNNIVNINSDALGEDPINVKLPDVFKKLKLIESSVEEFNREVLGKKGLSEGKLQEEAEIIEDDKAVLVDEQTDIEETDLEEDGDSDDGNDSGDDSEEEDKDDEGNSEKPDIDWDKFDL